MIEREARSHTDALERIMLALRDAREPHDVLAIVARSLAFELRRPCTAYELRDNIFRPVAASELHSVREPIAAASLALEEQRGHVAMREGTRDLIPVWSDGQLRALFVLDDGEAALAEDEHRFLEAVAAHAALALTTALSFEQLRRYAAEGAALTEAARTILGFTELEPLAQALCSLALRLVRAERACVYGRAEGGERLVLIGCESSGAGSAPPANLPADRDAAQIELRQSFGNTPLVVTPMSWLGVGTEGGGLLVVSRRRGPFGKPELRVIDALVTLAALAIRNVELFEQSTRANRALAESNAFKDDLMAMFAHDFKGPLTVISGYAELMLEHGDAGVRSSAATMIEQTRRLAKLAEDALALAATQSAGFSLRRRRGDLVAFVREAARALAGGAERIAVEAPEEPLSVSFDRARLRHVVDNLIGNALKFSDGAVSIRVRRARSEALVEVSDRGIGIPAGDLEKIFTRFGRGSNARSQGISGTGVGLYIARKIMEVHGGRLEVTSREGEGTTFTLALPLSR